jgi:hypothetical protein
MDAHRSACVTASGARASQASEENVMRKALSTLLCVLLVLPGLAAWSTAVRAAAEPPAGPVIDDPWPRQLTSGGNTFSIFQPQCGHR